MYAHFENIEAFNTWHDSVKISMGFPIQCYRGTGEEIPGSFVENYTIPISHPLTDSVIASYDERSGYDGPSLTSDEAFALGYFTPPDDGRE